jgi:hypothetical protein
MSFSESFTLTGWLRCARESAEGLRLVADAMFQTALNLLQSLKQQCKQQTRQQRLQSQKEQRLQRARDRRQRKRAFRRQHRKKKLLHKHPQHYHRYHPHQHQDNKQQTKDDQEKQLEQQKRQQELEQQEVLSRMLSQLEEEVRGPRNHKSSNFQPTPVTAFVSTMANSGRTAMTSLPQIPVPHPLGFWTVDATLRTGIAQGSGTCADTVPEADCMEEDL